MARNDIRFGQAQQADFGQANAMYRTALEQSQLMLASGQKTLDDFNKAVTANNDAKIKAFINSFGKDELEQNRDTINEFIADLDSQSGGMYSKEKALDYHDNRMGDLITRDNQRMLNVEKGIAHQDVLDVDKAKDLFAPHGTSIYQDPTNPNHATAFNQAVNDLVAGGENPNVVYELAKMFNGTTTNALKDLTGVSRGNQEYAVSEVFKDFPQIQGLANMQENIANQRTNLTNDLNAGKISADDYKSAWQALDTKSQEVDSLVKAFMSSDNPYLQSARMQSLVNEFTARDKANAEKAQAQNKHSLDWARHHETVRSNKANESQAGINSDRQFELGQATNDINALKAVHEVNKPYNTGGSGSGSGGSGGSDKTVKTGSEVFDSFYAPQARVQKPDGTWTLDMATIGNRLNSRASLLAQESEKPYLNMSYRSYVTNRDILAQANASENAQGRNLAQGYSSRWEVMTNYLENDKTLTDAQKIYILDGLITGELTFDTWLNKKARGDDSATGEMKAYLEKVVNPAIDRHKEQTAQKVKAEIHGLAQGLGISEADTLKAIQPYINDNTFALLPKEWQDIVRPPKQQPTVRQTVGALFNTSKYAPKPTPIPYARGATNQTKSVQEVNRVINNLPKPNNNNVPYAYANRSMFGNWYNR